MGAIHSSEEFIVILKTKKEKIVAQLVAFKLRIYCSTNWAATYFNQLLTTKLKPELDLKKQKMTISETRGRNSPISIRATEILF